MAKRYLKVNFQNSPSVATPLNAANLNKLDKGIDDCDNAIEDLYTVKLNTANIANNLVTTAAGLALDARQGKILKDEVNAINNNLAGWRFYSELSQLGITVGTETMEVICQAMPIKSTLKFYKYTSNTSTAYPANAGILTIDKINNTRIELSFTNGGADGVVKKWYGYADANITPYFTGWKMVTLT